MVTVPHTVSMTTTVLAPTPRRTRPPSRAKVLRAAIRDARVTSDQEFADRLDRAKLALGLEEAVTQRLADIVDLQVTRVPGR